MNSLPDSSAATRARVESLRGPKRPVDPYRPSAVIRESEATRGARAADSTAADSTAADAAADNAVDPPLADVVSVFLTGAECPLRCTMCDLWQNTLDGPTPPGALPRQLAIALADLPDPVADAGRATAGTAAATTSRSHNGSAPQPRWIKLYNASNFFDRRAVPRRDWDAIAAAVQPFSRVIVENHPRWVNDSVAEFARRIAGRLEVAMGLEIADDASLRLLNKRATLADFSAAADRLRSFDVDLRLFVMLQPPGTAASIATARVLDSLRFAERLGARHVSVIPTRGGNGMLESLAAEGLFLPPTARQLEATIEAALAGRFECVITADLWDWDRLSGHCATCRQPRRERLQQINLTQRPQPPHQSPAAGCDCR